MVNVASSRRPGAVRRRQIADEDLPGVATLLSGGFRFRPVGYWMRGLSRLRARAVPDGYPRYGYLLESDGRIVGALLTIFASVAAGAQETIRCNLSSWYVEPDFRHHATLLLSYALKDRAVTYTNLSAAPNTVSTIAVQGFVATGTGKYLAFPALARREGRARVVPFASLPPDDRARLDPADLSILDQHAGWGCLALTVQECGVIAPFVFVRRRVLRRLVPTCALVYCRDMREFVRFAPALGRYLLTRGAPSVLLDDDPASRLLPGFAIERSRSRYARGPHIPEPGDIAFSEAVFFGS